MQSLSNSESTSLSFGSTTSLLFMELSRVFPIVPNTWIRSMLKHLLGASRVQLMRALLHFKGTFAPPPYIRYLSRYVLL